MLRALGWDVEDVDEVQREFKTQPRHKPVDYGLLVVRTPRLLIEAKALGENLVDHRWVNQIMGYASVAGVEWVVLTDGDEYRIYNTHAPVAVEEKLFRSVKVTAVDGGQNPRNSGGLGVWVVPGFLPAAQLLTLVPGNGGDWHRSHRH